MYGRIPGQRREIERPEQRKQTMVGIRRRVSFRPLVPLTSRRRCMRYVRARRRPSNADAGGKRPAGRDVTARAAMHAHACRVEVGFDGSSHAWRCWIRRVCVCMGITGSAWRVASGEAERSRQLKEDLGLANLFCKNVLVILQQASRVLLHC